MAEKRKAETENGGQTKKANTSEEFADVLDR
jgi:hypothetical protein